MDEGRKKCKDSEKAGLLMERKGTEREREMQNSTS